MKVKVRRVYCGKSKCNCVNDNSNIIIPMATLNHNNVKIQIEVNDEEISQDACSQNGQNIINKNNEAKTKRLNLVSKIFKIITTSADKLANSDQDGALSARILSSGLMRLVAWFGYTFSIYLVPRVIYNLVKDFKTLDAKFVITAIVSFVFSLFISLSTFIISKGIMVDAIKLEENKDVNNVYSVASIIATILFGILALK